MNIQGHSVLLLVLSYKSDFKLNLTRVMMWRDSYEGLNDFLHKF